MFYSHLLLSKKGALGIVWMAAHCLKRLKKDQVQQTNVSAAVDKILDEEVPVVTHRILAFLLLGVVRIYSQKVEYLHNDCHDVLNKLCGSFETGKSIHGGSGTPQKHFHSITLPKSFELDAFDLELVEDQDDEDLVRNVRPNKQITLAAVHGKASNARSLLYKEKTALTPPRVVLSPHYMDKHLLMGSSTSMKFPLADLEIVPGTGFYLEDQMDPMLLDEDEEEELQYKASNDHSRAITELPAEEMTPDSVQNLINNICTSIPSLEILCETSFSVEDYIDPPALNSKDQGCDEFSDNAQLVAVTRRKLLEVVTPDSMDCDTTDVFPVSHDDAPDPMPPDTGSSGVANILTPAAKESGKFQKKRKVLFDSTTVLPDVVIRKLIEEDPSDLKRERKTVPKTPLQAWRASKLGHATLKFTEPLMSGASANLGFLQCEESCAGAIAAVEVSVTPGNNQSPIARGVNEQIPDTRSTVIEKSPESIIEKSPESIIVKSPKPVIEKSPEPIIEKSPEPVIEKSLEQTRFAPGTPGSCLIPLRSHEIRAATDSNILEPTSLAPRTPISRLIPWRSHETRAATDSDILEHSASLASIEENAFSDGGLELDAMSCEETNSCDGDSLENYTFSARTRKFGSYLHEKFMDKSRKNEEEVLYVSKLLEGKTKKASARLFYDILVLKTRDCVDVIQENAYGDIMLQEGSKLKLALQH